ncbi:MAG: hypothetical protein IJA83_03585 [Clostridia bacterium]|nr:hypothetical protein [Clostridia bacterium]
MENVVISLPALLWQIFNVVVLIAVFAFLVWRTVRAVRRALADRRRKHP